MQILFWLYNVIEDAIQATPLLNLIIFFCLNSILLLLLVRSPRGCFKEILPELRARYDAFPVTNIDFAGRI